MLTYRTGNINDLQQLKAICIDAYSQFEAVLEPAHWEQFRNNLYDEQGFIDLINKSVVFVCADGDTLAGAAYLLPHGNPTDLFPADWCYIRRVGVAHNYRGMGIAQRLTEQCIAHARNTGERTIALHTSEFMDDARHIYEKAGFTRLEEVKALFGKKYWLYKMELGDQ